MQSKGQVAAKVIGIILVLALLAGLVAVIYKFTNGFNEDFKTFYVEHEGKQFLSAQNDLVLEDAGVHRFDVKYGDRAERGAGLRVPGGRRAAPLLARWRSVRGV